MQINNANYLNINSILKVDSLKNSTIYLNLTDPTDLNVD